MSAQLDLEDCAAQSELELSELREENKRMRVALVLLKTAILAERLRQPNCLNTVYEALQKARAVLDGKLSGS